MIHVVSTIRPALFRSPVTGRLQLAGGTVLSVNGAAPVSGYPEVPEGTTPDMIRWSAPAPSKAVKPSAVKTYTVEGSRGQTYTVTVAGARVTCTCPGYTFRRTCKHTKQVRP